jgi:hypothetical protein
LWESMSPPSFKPLSFIGQGFFYAANLIRHNLIGYMSA